MNMSPRTGLLAAGGLILVLCTWLASFFIAQTPGAVFDGPILERQTPQPPGETVAYTVEEGMSAEQVGADLERLGVIRSGRQFQVLAALMGVHNKLSAGDYELRKNSAVPSVVLELTVQESVPVVRMTFPEGIRIEEMAAIVERSGFATEQAFLAAVRQARVPEPFAAAFPPGATLQGYLFPDTYIIPREADAAFLVAKMMETLEERFTPELRQAAAARGLNTHEVLTLAAIVEREAVLEEERPIIASVFLNRLKDGIKLDADPTVQFALAEDPANVDRYGYWKKELTLEELKVASPYNTYANAGLPPGPIANPGLSSIRAVVMPAQTNYYYFVADAIKGDGSHAFAATLEEHEANRIRVGNR